MDGVQVVNLMVSDNVRYIPNDDQVDDFVSRSFGMPVTGWQPQASGISRGISNPKSLRILFEGPTVGLTEVDLETWILPSRCIGYIGLLLLTKQLSLKSEMPACNLHAHRTDDNCMALMT